MQSQWILLRTFSDHTHEQKDHLPPLLASPVFDGETFCFSRYVPELSIKVDKNITCVATQGCFRATKVKLPEKEGNFRTNIHDTLHLISV